VVVLNTGYIAHAGGVDSLRSNDRLAEQLLGVY
jgi:branched-chain amino acid transport system ATP-binding protein